MRFPALHARAARTDEAGFTFIEVLITLAFLSFAFIAIIGALGSMVVASDTHSRIAKAEGRVRAAAELVKSPEEVAYVACGANPGAAYQAALDDPDAFPPAPNHTATVLSVRPWLGDSPATFGEPGTCPTDGVDRGAQLVTIEVMVTGRDAVTQQVDVMKRQS